MLSIDEAIDHNATAARLRYLTPGVALRLSDIRDPLGGYACQIVGTEDHTVWIDLPIRRDGMLDLAVGALVSARFDRPGDAVYLFDTVVTEIRGDDTRPYGLAAPVTIYRRAHRTDTRLSMVLDAIYTDPEGRERRGKVVDLSAGGLALICPDALEEGAEVIVHCSVPGPDHRLSIDQPARIRSSSFYARTPGGRILHHYGLEFLDEDDELREEILSSVIWNLTQNPEVL